MLSRQEVRRRAYPPDRRVALIPDHMILARPQVMSAGRIAGASNRCQYHFEHIIQRYSDRSATVPDPTPDMPARRRIRSGHPIRPATSALTLTAALVAAPVCAEPVLGLHGSPGLIDMPTAEMMRDGTISLGYAQLPESVRFTAGFQALPRLNVTFRYSGIGDLGGFTESSGYSLWDRSLDLSVLLLEEGRRVPAVALGIRDVLGTGVLGSEYIVATKTITPALTISTGLGWGRLGSANVIGSTGTRPASGSGAQGGALRLDSLFRGDVGLFGGLRWQTPVEGLSLAVEYASDDYSAEAPFGVARAASPWSVGLNWAPAPGLALGLHAFQGGGLAFNLAAQINPRDPDLRAKPDWQPPAGTRGVAAFQGSGVTPLALGRRDDTCRAAVDADGVRAAAVGVDRAARALAAQGCTSGTLRLVRDGLALSETRVDLSGEDPVILGSGPAAPDASWAAPVGRPAFDWSVAPLVRVSLFDPDRPIYHDVSLALAASYRLAPGFSLSGQLSHTAIGDFDDIRRGPKGSLPPVRTDIARYLNERGPRLDHLTLDLMTQHTALVFSRLSVGYLETMYAGVSGEVYARHARLPLAVALEVNAVRARDFDQGLGLRDLPGLATVHGHASVFWNTGFHDIDVQLDVGRYLAGDIGATLSVSRDFRNGWKIGAFATRTDASAADFGEGSYDKGIFFRLPLAIVWPRETGIAAEQRISSLTGDGGQRLAIRNRLHEIVSRGDAAAVLGGCRPPAPCFSQ